MAGETTSQAQGPIRLKAVDTGHPRCPWLLRVTDLSRRRTILKHHSVTCPEISSLSRTSIPDMLRPLVAASDIDEVPPFPLAATVIVVIDPNGA